MCSAPGRETDGQQAVVADLSTRDVFFAKVVSKQCPKTFWLPLCLFFFSCSVCDVCTYLCGELARIP